MLTSKTILPRVGVGQMRFGMRGAEVRRLLGDPEFVDAELVPDWESWNYPYVGLELTFALDEGSRCTLMSTEDPSFLICGMVVLGRKLSDLVDTAPDFQMGAAFVQHDSDIGPTLRFSDSDVDVHFDDEISTYVDWSAHIDEKDQYRFPSTLNAV